MIELKGIFAASLSILKSDLSLDIDNTIKHAENVIDMGCHGAVFFGSTGQSQLISLSEKIQLINKLPESRYKDKFIIGTGLNSLADNINLIKISKNMNFNTFLIMPPAYYKYDDKDVINFYTKIIEQVNDCKIILYNFEKLSGYKFSPECIQHLVKIFPDQIVGVKDSSYNLFENLKIKNFSIFPGSEAKLLNGLEIGCDGIITATTNVTGHLARKIFDNYKNNLELTSNQNLCDIRACFDKYNLISCLHTLMSQKNPIYKNLLPPLKLLDVAEKKNLLSNLKKLNFNMEILKAA